MKKHKIKKKKKPTRKLFFDSQRSQSLWIPQSNKMKIQNTPIADTWFLSQRFESIYPNSQILIKDFNLSTLESCIRCRRIELYPTTKQKKIFNKWIDIYRLVYNLTVRYFRLHPEARKNFYDTRAIIKSSLNNNSKLSQWIKKSKIPSHTMDYAIKDVIDAYSSAFSNYKNGNIAFFKLRYKKKTSPRQTIVLESSAFSLFKKKNTWKKKIHTLEDRENDSCSFIKYLYGYDHLENYQNDEKLDNSFCTSVFGKHIQSSERIDQVDKNCRLSYYPRLGSYFLFIPYDKEVKRVELSDICVMDPGVRTFQTGYTSNEVLELGNDTSDIIGYLHREIDRSQKKKDMNQYHRTQRKLKHKIEELHDKVANFLTSKYKCIIVGNVSTKDTNNRKTSKLRKKTKRIFSSLGHTMFRNKLASKCEERGVYYEIVDESYTSKTCSNCGGYKDNLGGNKVYKCESCKIILDRDVNACRNILIKNQDRVLCSLEA